MDMRITLATSIHLLKDQKCIKDYPDTILMKDCNNKRTGGIKRSIIDIENKAKDNWIKENLSHFKETKEGTKKIDKIREHHMEGHEVFASMDSELWMHAPLSYTKKLSDDMLREIAIIRQQDEITAYDSAKSTSEDEVKNTFLKKDGRSPCNICS